MGLIDSVLPEIKTNIRINQSNREYSKIKDAANVLNIAYLKQASIEMKYYLARNSKHRIPSKFSHLMGIYYKLIREHQILFLMLNIFETALRSKAAIRISDTYSSGQDNWWKDISRLDKDLLDPVNKAVSQLHQSNIDLTTVTTFDLFDTLTLGQLENIYKNKWSLFHGLFAGKTYRTYRLPQITKANFMQKMKYIRKARNDVAHHKPIDYTRRPRRELIHDMEVILRHLNYNVEDAVNGIDPRHVIIHLRYL